MNPPRQPRTGRFSAPWGGPLTAVSLAATALILGVTALVWLSTPAPDATVRWAVSLGSAGLLGGTALFAVRGYELRGRELLIRRLAWCSRIPLDGLRAAYADPAAMRGALRLFGNGGLFAFTGLSWNRRLGRFRAYATDPRRAVVLELPARTLVVTPDRPGAFLEALGLGPAPESV
jgi:hypothetical protein